MNRGIICTMPGSMMPGLIDTARAAAQSAGLVIGVVGDRCNETPSYGYEEFEIYLHEEEVEILKIHCSICKKRDANRLFKGKDVCTICKPLNVRR